MAGVLEKRSLTRQSDRCLLLFTILLNQDFVWRWLESFTEPPKLSQFFIKLSHQKRTLSLVSILLWGYSSLLFTRHWKRIANKNIMQTTMRICREHAWRWWTLRKNLGKRFCAFPRKPFSNQLDTSFPTWITPAKRSVSPTSVWRLYRTSTKLQTVNTARICAVVEIHTNIFELKCCIVFFRLSTWINVFKTVR